MRVPSGYTTCWVKSDQGPVEIRVDKAHAWMLKAWTWTVSGYGYVCRKTSRRVPDRPYPVAETIYLHCELLGLPRGDPRKGDHINGDTLDNRLSTNLEIVTHAENIKRSYQTRGRAGQ